MSTQVITPTVEILQAMLERDPNSIPDAEIRAYQDKFGLAPDMDYIQIVVPEGFSHTSCYDGKMVMCNQLHDFGTLIVLDSRPELFNF